MKIICALFLFLVLNSCTSIEKLPYASDKPEIVIALKFNPVDQNDLADARQHLHKLLTYILGKPVRVIIPKNNRQISEGFRDGTIDLGYLNAIDMYNAEKIDLAEILLARTGSENNYFNCYFLVKKNSSYNSIKDLKNKPIAFATNYSASGYLIPYLNLINMGVLKEKEKPEAFFGKNNVWFGQGYLSAIERVLSGEAQVAAVSDSIFDEPDSELTPEKKAQLRVLHTLKSVPSHMIAARKSLTSEQISILKKALLQVNKYPKLEEKVFYSKLVEVDQQSHLEVIREAFKKTGLTIETR